MTTATAPAKKQAAKARRKATPGGKVPSAPPAEKVTKSQAAAPPARTPAARTTAPCGYSLRPLIGGGLADFVTPPDGEPVWPLAELMFPAQGKWTIEDYLRLKTARLVEFDEGRLEFLPMPTDFHQGVVGYFYMLLVGLIQNTKRGAVRFAPLKVHTLHEKLREPDVAVLLRENFEHRADEAWGMADLVIEVVSKDDPNRDYVDKRAEYAAAGFREYWIVDPQARHVLLLVLDGETYREVGTFRDNDAVTSELVDGFTVKVSDVWAAGEA